VRVKCLKIEQRLCSAFFCLLDYSKLFVALWIQA
jgi:hypothetical protein